MLTVDIHTDLYNAGMTEDGLEYHAECYYVIVKNDYGRRWRHEVTFFGASRVVSDDCVFFPDLRHSAIHKASVLLSLIRVHLEAGGKLNENHWSEMPAVYGSEAYYEGGEFEMSVWERSLA